MKAGEQVLLPRIREAASSTLVLTDGFSCHSQIQHGSGRRALHLAEAIRMALPVPAVVPASPGTKRGAGSAAVANAVAGSAALGSSAQ
jgi:hypothetical protein